MDAYDEPLRILLLGEDGHACTCRQSAVSLGLQRELEANKSPASGQLERSSPCFSIVDGAGEVDVVGDLLTGSIAADTIVVVVSADKRALQWAIRDGGRIREQMKLAACLGFKSLVVCVDHMSFESEFSAEHRFGEVKKELADALASSAFHPNAVPFVPVADLSSSEHVLPLPWYAGPSLLQALADVRTCRDLCSKPLRVPLHEIFKVRGDEMVAVGRVEMGILTEDVQLLLSPGGVPVCFRCIEVNGESAQHVRPGETVRFVGIQRNAIADKDPEEPLRFEIGNVLSDATRGTAQDCKVFLVEIIVLRSPPKGCIKNGDEVTLDIHTAHVPCVISELRWRRRAHGSRQVDQHPHALSEGDIAEAWLEPFAPVCVENFSFCPPLGRFALCDKELTIAAGIVLEVRRSAVQYACFDD